MANLTANRDDQLSDGTMLVFPMAAVKIYQGALVCINTSGYLTNAADTASFIFAGSAIDFVDNSAGSAGALTMRVRVSGVIQCVTSGATQATVGAKVYASDNQTVATSTSNSVLVGRVVEYDSATSVRVRMASISSAN